MKQHGSMIAQLEKRGVLVKVGAIDLAPKILVIGDSETDPARIVPRNGIETRFILNEAGVLIASPDTEMRDELSLNPEALIYEPVSRAVSSGFTFATLFVNASAVAGIMAETDTKDLIDHMMRARAELQRRQPRLKATCILHVPASDGRWVNYVVVPDKWFSYIANRESRVLGRGYARDMDARRPEDDRQSDPDFAQA